MYKFRIMISIFQGWPRKVLGFYTLSLWQAFKALDYTVTGVDGSNAEPNLFKYKSPEHSNSRRAFLVRHNLSIRPFLPSG